MDVVAGIDALDRSTGRLFVVVGVFDGIHRGHAYLLRQLRRHAATRGARPAVITFDHHPDEILTGAAPPLLCDPDERLERLASAGVGVTVVQHFDQALRMTTYDAFIGGIVDRVSLAGFLMTPDAAFGHERHGTVDAVAALGRRLGYEVAVVPTLTLDGRPVRSAEIRRAIAAGDLRAAARLLGRAVGLTGTAQRLDHGATALCFDLPVALPPNGRYEARVAVARDGRGLERELVVEGDAAVIEPPIDVTDGRRVRVRLPVPGLPATIRRSK